MADLRGWFNYRKVYDWVAKKFSVPGGLEVCEGNRTACSCAPRFVEVGVWKGASLVYLCKKLMQTPGYTFDLFAVDPWDMSPVLQVNGGHDYNVQLDEMKAAGITVEEVFRRNLRDLGLQDLVTVVSLESVKAAPLIVEADFVFLDGCHETEAVIDDIEAWGPRTAILAGHDAYEDSVKAALERSFGKTGYWASGSSGGCWTTDPGLGKFIVDLSVGTPYEDMTIRKEPQHA